MDPGGQTIGAQVHLTTGDPIRTLVIWGTRDRMIPVGHAERAPSIFPGAEVVLFEGARHFPHLEQPDRFASVLEDFIHG